MQVYKGLARPPPVPGVCLVIQVLLQSMLPYNYLLLLVDKPLVEAIEVLHTDSFATFGAQVSTTASQCCVSPTAPPSASAQRPAPRPSACRRPEHPVHIRCLRQIKVQSSTGQQGHAHHSVPAARSAAPRSPPSRLSSAWHWTPPQRARDRPLRLKASFK